LLIILLIVAAIWLSFGALATVATVGKKREPITGGVAAFTVLVTAGIIWLLLWAAMELDAA
jgi:hypothetical protein